MVKTSLLAAMVFYLASCSKDRQANIDHTVKIVSNDDLSFVFDKSILKIDSREPSAYEASHLPDSINMTLKDVMNSPEKVIPVLDKWKERKMVIYCYGRSCDSSMTVARHLIYGGYKVYVYKNGWNTIKELIDQRQ